MSEVMELMVNRIADEAEGIRSFEFTDIAGGLLPPFTAGAHIDVHVAGGSVRQYSLLNDDRERHRYVIAVLREEAGRGVSRHMHDRVKPGMRLKVGSPRNAFPLDDGKAPAVLLAGGIGITPLLAMARHMQACSRSFTLHFATRSMARTPFRNELVQHAFGSSRIFFHYDDGPPAQRIDLAAISASLAPGTHVYLCGPRGFMAAASAALQSRNDVTLHTEYFAAAQVAGPGDAFRLVLARSGIQTVVPAGVSIVEVLRQHGLQPPVSCEQGICGTCLTRVMTGEIDHRDHYLSATERACGDRMLVCVSRGNPDSTLTLDL